MYASRADDVFRRCLVDSFAYRGYVRRVLRIRQVSAGNVQFSIALTALPHAAGRRRRCMASFARQKHRLCVQSHLNKRDCPR